MPFLGGGSSSGGDGDGAALARANAAYSLANNAKTTADNAKTSSGTASANASAAVAKANQTKQDLDDLIAAGVGSQDDLDRAQSAADAAQIDATKALTDAFNAASVASQAATAAQTAQESAENAYSYAVAAQTTADGARSAADSAATIANGAAQDVVSAKTRADSAYNLGQSAAGSAANADSKATFAGTAASSAQTDATKALGDAATAKARADTAFTNAGSAANAATLAQNTADGAAANAVSAGVAAGNADSKAVAARNRADDAYLLAGTANDAASAAQSTANSVQATAVQIRTDLSNNTSAITRNSSDIRDLIQGVTGASNTAANAITLATTAKDTADSALESAQAAFILPAGGISMDILSQDVRDAIATSGGGGGGGAPIDDSSVSAVSVWSSQKISSVNATLSQVISGKYTVPAGGITSADFSSAVVASLSRADSAYQLPANGIPLASLAGGIQSSLGRADSAYQKPAGGIGTSDLATAITSSLAKADSATQGGYIKPVNGITTSDFAQSVIDALNKANSALQSAPVKSVANRTGAVTLTKSDVGLPNADNTSDINKPVSAATLSTFQTLAQSQAPRSQAVVVMGDSIDQGGDADSVHPFWSGSVWSHFAVASKGLFQLTHNVGIGGQNTAQMLARFVTDVVGYQPGIVIIGGGRNDLNGGVATATTRANIMAMVSLALSNGIRPVLHTLAPTDQAGGGAFNTIALNRQGTIDHNTWLKSWATGMGIPVLDLWGVWADPATGGYKAGYSDDGTHPNLLGLNAAVAYLGTGVLPAFFGGSPRLATTNTDPTNAFVNGLASTDANSDGLPDNWYFPDTTGVTFANAAYGKSVTLTTTGSQRIMYGPGTTPGSFAVGDVLAFSGRISSSGGTKVSVLLENQDYSTIASPVVNFTEAINDGTWYIEYTVESTVTQIFAAFLADVTAGSITVSQLTLRNLSLERRTRLGLGNLNNTADLDKPVSTATVTALALKAPLASPTFTGTVSGVTKAMVGLPNVANLAPADLPISTATQAALNAKTSVYQLTSGTPNVPAGSPAGMYFFQS